MEVAPSGPQTLSEPHRRGTPLPLSQLVEETRSAASIPNHLLESKIYTQLNGNSQIQAEPAELHFTGFELGKNYTKILKLVNISSEVLDVHIIPTLTKHFQTTYTKKCRLIPGLAYTLKVAFCPAEWRYFYDCVRVHCKGEDNLLIPVHAYPVIDDLHIPPRIDLSAVPLGQSVRHAIPLRCSCPIDFEFQVYVIQPHEAFSIHPLIGVIPANGEAKITVTFSPVRYETSQFTFQLVVSQFNTKPYLCTVTGSSSPHLALSLIPHELDRMPQDRASAPAESAGRPAPAQRPPSRKSRQSWTREADKLKPAKDQLGVQHGPPPSMAACTPAGVAKMLIRDINKLHSKDLKQGTFIRVRSRRRRRGCGRFWRKERRLCMNTWSKKETGDKRKPSLLSRRNFPLDGCSVMRDSVSRSREVLVENEIHIFFQTLVPCLRFSLGKGPDGEPDFQLYTSIPWELKQRALTLFQQAARKVAIRCRVQHRLASLKELADSMENVKDKTCDFEVSLSNVFPSSFPIFSLEDNPMALRNLEALPVDPIDVTVTADIPYFKLQVPQHYKLMGYQPVSAWEAFNSYVPTTPARPLRAGAPEAQGPAKILCTTEVNVGLSEEEPAATSETARLSFSAPEALIRPLPAHPLRIFNPAPGLQTYNPQPKYLDSDLESHLCPLPGYAHRGSDASGLMTPTPHTQVLRHEETSCGIVRRRDSDSVSNESLISSPPRRSTDYNAGILPLSAPPSVAALPDDLPPLTEASCAGSGVQLTPEMIRAGFLMRNPPLAAGTRARLEVTHRSEINQMQTRLMTRLKQLEGEEREGKTAAHTHPPRE